FSVGAADVVHPAGRLYLSRPHGPHAQVPARAAVAGGAGTRRAPDRGRSRVIVTGGLVPSLTARPLLSFLAMDTPREECRMPRWLLVILVFVGGCGGAGGQTLAGQPIRAIVAFAAGRATDGLPRLAFEPLSAQLGQPIVVENRGGAGTTIGAAMVAKAEPDGYTLLATSSAHTLVPTVYPNASYDTAADFAAVVSLGSSPNVLVVSPSKRFKTAHDLVAAAKARPGSFNFASAGVGSATHLSAERFRMAAGFDAVHVPFRGGAEALTEVLSGRAEFYFCPLGTALPQVREGKLMALAVSSPKRAALLPDVPSVLELF